MNYLVAGSGKSGIGAVRLLLKLGENVVLYDGNDKLDKDEIAKKIGNDNVEIILGELKDEDISKADVMIISPGIPIDADFVNKVDFTFFKC